MQFRPEFQPGFRQYLKQLPAEGILIGRGGVEGKVKSGNWKGKVFRKMKMKIAIWEVGGHWTVDTDITVVYFTLH